MDRPRAGWLPAFGIFLGVVGCLNLAWEILHLPLYTIWTTDTVSRQAFAVLHCTGGDLLIALSSLMGALLITWSVGWPHQGFWSVMIATITLGLSYTVFSEWLNVYVRQSWAYSDWMPIVTVGTVRIGLSPLLQWLIVPTLAFFVVDSIVRRRVR